jgi:hypothetical protein
MVSTWSQSGDGTTTIEQYAKPAADGGQAWLLWARRQDKPSMPWLVKLLAIHG